MKVKAVSEGVPSPYFTDGKVYEARKPRGGEHTCVWEVQDDKGNPRVILLDERCPHFRLDDVLVVTGLSRPHFEEVK